MNEGNTADQQQEKEGVESIPADSMIVEEGQSVAVTSSSTLITSSTTASSALITSSATASAVEMINVSFSSDDGNDKIDNCSTEKPEDSTKEENMILILDSADKNEAAQSEISELDTSENTDEGSKETTKQTESYTLRKSVESKLKAVLQIPVSSNADQDASAGAAETVKDTAIPEIVDQVELTGFADTIEDAVIAGAVEDAVISGNNVENSGANCVEDSTQAAPTLAVGDNEECPVSPSSDKEIDLSDDKVLHIDEAEASHSEDVADISHTSSGTVETIASDCLEGNSSMIAKPKDVVVAPESEVGENSKEVLPEGKDAISSKKLSSIEDSIERCIANNMIESDTPIIAPTPKKRAAHVTVKPVESDKFPRNYGFKIITNKIDLSNSTKTMFSTVPKLEASNIPLKKLKLKAKPLADSKKQVVELQEGVLQENNAGNDALSPKTKGITIAFQKSTDESGEIIAPKERSASGLKVRNVESINAAITNVKAPVCQLFSEDANKFPDTVSITNETLPDKEVMNHVSDKSVESDLTVATIFKPGLRPIAPKCEPIASNDLKAIKLIRDLIQLPSVPVYVPDISDSKHFNGRLHLCHGCGDRFVLLKSLLEHQNRRSCIIKYQCLKCDSITLCFFNRCEFIRHLYNHNQTLTTFMLQHHIIVERLPNHNSGIFDVKICQECKVFLNKVSLSDHMQGLDMKERKGPDLGLKCQWCSLLLPTKCSYQAHRRMHFLQPPHVCPECGDMSPDLPSFNIHINSVCFHTSKRSLFMCSYCKAEMFDARKLERHIRIKHIRDVFKCNFCFVACFNMKDLEKHKRQYHEGKVTEEGEDEDDSGGLKYAFHLCDMCPNRLIRRVRLGQHVWDHTYSNNDVSYVYECRKCKVSFSSRDILSGHSTLCTAGSSAANAPSYATVVANGNEVIVQQPNPSTSEIIVVETPPVTDFNTELQSDFAESTGALHQTSHLEEDEDDMMVIDETEAPPPLQKAPVTKPVLPLIGQPGKAPVTVAEKKKKKKPSPKKTPFQPDNETLQQPNDDNSFNSFESELFMDANDLDAEEGGMEVVLNCLECGTNLTSELGSYCTLCEQKREAGSETFKTATPNPLLNIAKKKTTRKAPLAGGNFSCRICNALISRTCDKAAIKRHFISKHKEIFIAALQTGMNANKNVSKVSKPTILSHKRTDSSSIQNSPPKKSPVASFSKTPKKKKKTRKPIGGNVSQSDTDDEDFVVSSPTKESKKKDKRKKSYSPSFPALEQGMVASDEKDTETRENVRYCYKCSFKSADKEEFMSHLTTHKTNPKDLQCPACGMCFVVRPSLEKHLLILHGMKNVEEYLVEHGFPPVEKTVEDVDAEMFDINQCKVCHMKFDSEALLEKHFRTHGSAFLLSKQLRRS